jgi:nuclear transport factor 2 (NTF2) superfamily protein
MLVLVNAEELLRTMYTGFNARDIDAVLAAMTADVDWPNAWEGGRLRGHDAVRDYWSRQWAAIDPRVEPVAMHPRDGRRIAVEVDQVVRDLAGEEVASGRVLHVYELRDGLVARMDVEEP